MELSPLKSEISEWSIDADEYVENGNIALILQRILRKHMISFS